MYLLAIDTETTGLDVTKDNIIELGYAIYHIDNPAPLVMRNSLIYIKSEIPEIITEITGITQAMLEKAGERAFDVFTKLLKDISDYDIKWFIGQNILEFDSPILYNNLLREGLTFPKLNMIDTKTDIKWSVPTKSNKLSYLAADHGFINPFPHRALTDAMTCAVLLYKYDIYKILEISVTSMLEIRADVNYDSRELAKTLGYYWDGERKIWVKKIREFYLNEEKSKATFPVLITKKYA